MKKLIVLLIIISVLGCAHLAVSSAEQKKPSTEQSAFSKEANTYFWENFHASNYDSIPKIIQKLSMALSQNPNDLLTTAHLGFVHIWALSERQRRLHPDPLITENAFLAKRYFEEAYTMNDADPRILGFLADMTLAEGAVLNNKKEQTEGYFMGLKSVKQWPQFNKFTIGYSYSGLPTGNKNFEQGLKWQYESMTDCACEIPNASSLTDEEKTKAINTSKTERVTRACGNTWIAPHNLEGFFLNMGDMLVKNGQTDEAVKIYALAKLSDTYDKWIYKDELEERIRNVKENVSLFNQPINEVNLKNQTVMMVNSAFSCMGCHGMSKEEQISFGESEPPLSYYYFLKSKMK